MTEPPTRLPPNLTPEIDEYRCQRDLVATIGQGLLETIALHGLDDARTRSQYSRYMHQRAIRAKLAEQLAAKTWKLRGKRR